MENNLTLHLKMFNSKIKLMNQTQSRDLTLSANEARNLHSDIFDLLNQISALSQELSKKSTETTINVIGMDGGTF